MKFSARQILTADNHPRTIALHQRNLHRIHPSQGNRYLAPIATIPKIDPLIFQFNPSTQRRLHEEAQATPRLRLEPFIALYLALGLAILVTLPISFATEFVVSTFRALTVPAHASVTLPLSAGNALQAQPTTNAPNAFPLYLPSVQNAAATDPVQIRAATTMSTTIYVSKRYSPDILALDLTTDTSTLYFDGSDVGIGSRDVDAFHLEADGSILLSLGSSSTVPGISGTVSDADIVRFIPTSLGTTTAGSFEFYFDGSDVGLTTAGEDIDALSRAPDGRLVISVLSSYDVPGLTGDDEDLLIFTATSLGETTAGSWERYLDGSAVGLADAADENIAGLWIDPTTGYLYLTTDKYFTTADGVSGDQDDLFRCEPITLGETSACTFALFWDGDGHNFIDNYIDAIHISDLQGNSGVDPIPLIEPIANSDGDGSYPVSWNAVPNALTYQLEEAPNGAAGTWQGVQSSAQTAYAANAPTSGPWCYRVRATYSNRPGSWSAPVCVTATAPGAAPPLLAESGPPLLYYSKFGQVDIMAYDLSTNQSSLYFDGSDVGFFGEDLDALHLEADGSILLSIDRVAALPGIVGQVSEADIIRFVPVTLGSTTIGTFEMVLDGSDVGLTAPLDDIVAIGRAPDGRLVISTKGYYDTNIATWPLDRNLIFSATTLGVDTTGNFADYFSSGMIGLNGSNDENVHALWIDGAAGDIYLVNRFGYELPNGLSGDSDDILRCTVETLGLLDGTTSCSSISRFWDGDAHGAGGALDAIALHLPHPAPGTLTGQVFLDTDYNGQRDGSDTGWADIPVTLWTKMGVAAGTTTDASGLYSFPAYPGRYAIGVAAQSGYQFVPQNVGDDATDSDVGPNGRSATVALTSTQVITIDAGLGIPPTPTPTPTPPQSPLPTPPPFSPLPTPTPTPEGYTLPTDRNLLNQCLFTPPPGGIPNEPIIPLSAYSFSAPQ